MTGLSIFALAVIFPLSLGADSDRLRPLETWELPAGGTPALDVGGLFSAQGEEEDPIPVEPSVTLEFHEGNFYKLSLVTRAAEGYHLPLLPGPPVHEPPPSSRAIAGFGYFSTRSDTLRFNAHYVRLFADGEDLEEIIRSSGDTKALKDYKFAHSFINRLVLELFNDLYAYESGDRLVFLLPGDSEYAGGAGAPVTVWELQRSEASTRSSSTAVEATVLGEAVEGPTVEFEGLTLEFGRAVSGRRPHYGWSEVTDEAGLAALDIATLDRSGVSGFYRARARNPSGELAGEWHSIPLNEGRLQMLELTIGGGMQVVSSEPLAASKQVGLVDEPGAFGLAPSYPNPFNSAAQIAYRLAAPGKVRLEIYNTLGQPVRTLVDEFQAAGRYQVAWDARDQEGAAVGAGVYFTRLLSPEGVETGRLLYLK